MPGSEFLLCFPRRKFQTVCVVKARLPAELSGPFCAFWLHYQCNIHSSNLFTTKLEGWWVLSFCFCVVREYLSRSNKGLLLWTSVIITSIFKETLWSKSSFSLTKSEVTTTENKAFSNTMGWWIKVFWLGEFKWLVPNVSLSKDPPPHDKTSHVHSTLPHSTKERGREHCVWMMI